MHFDAILFICELELDVIQIGQGLLPSLQFALVVEVLWPKVIAGSQLFVLFAVNTGHFLLEHLQISLLLMVLPLPVEELFVISFGLDCFVLEIEVLAVGLAFLHILCQSCQRLDDLFLRALVEVQGDHVGIGSQQIVQFSHVLRLYLVIRSG